MARRHPAAPGGPGARPRAARNPPGQSQTHRNGLRGDTVLKGTKNKGAKAVGVATGDVGTQECGWEKVDAHGEKERQNKEEMT